jgi:trk system potassium uptake protein TrkA
MRVILVGGGKTIYFLTKRFQSKNYHVTIITRDQAEARAFARDLQALVLLGDGTSPVLLRDAETTRADVLLALMPHDEDNLVACQIARRMFGVPHVVSLVNDPGNTELFHRLGIRATFSATDLLARLIEETTSLSQVMYLTPLAGGRAHVTEIVLPADAPAVGKAIRDLNPPAGSLIASLVRDDDVLVPSGATVLKASDRLVLISEPEGYGPLLRLLLGEHA